MASDFDAGPTKTIRTWLLTIVLLAGVIGFLIAIAITNYVQSGPSKMSGIINRLYQIDAAKQEWAREHGITNALQSNREPATKDLAPYLLVNFTRKDFGDPIYGERYFIGRLNESPKAELARDFRERGWPYQWKLPKGTIILLVGEHGKYILPGQESKPPKSLGEVLANEP